MGYDLYSRNKELISFHPSAWELLLKTEGAGLCIGVSSCIEYKAMFISDLNSNGHHPLDNNGFYVTSSQSKCLARAVITVVRKHENYREWLQNPANSASIEMRKEDGILTHKIREDFIENWKEMAEWMDKSRGFWIR